MKLISKKKPIRKIVPQVEEVEEIAPEEVESAEESQRENDLTDLQRTLAETELRIHQLDAQVEAEVEKRVSLFTASMNDYLARAEMQIFSRLVEFFQQCPAWEMHKMTKANSGATQFYSPHDAMKSLFAKGWKWMGQYYDEKNTEHYHLFVRQKELPRYQDQLLKMYDTFRAPPPVVISAKRPAGKVGLKLKVTTTVSKTK